MDYFTLFQLPVSLKADADAVRQAYYRLSLSYHPDRFTLSSEAERDAALDMSAAVNEGKKVLDDPHRRLEYILKQNGHLEEGEKYALSPAFLGEMMELNEQVMELAMDPNPEARQALQAELTRQEAECRREVQALFDMDELATDEAGWKALKEYYFRRKYLQRLSENLAGSGD
jgi:molecular chaperone HscB